MATLGSGNVQIDTYGELKTLIRAITLKQKGLKIKGIIIDTIADEIIGKLPGGPAAKKTLDFVKAAFGKPDSVKTNTWLDRLDVDDQLSAIVDDTVENRFLQDISKRIEGQSDNTPLRQDFNMNTELVDFLKRHYKGRTVVGPQQENKKMKKSQLREIILEELRGYSKYAPGGTTSGGTTADFATILKNIALGKDQRTRGNDALDRADQEKVAQILRGEKPTYGDSEQEVNEGASTLTVSQVKSEIKGLEPKDIVKIQYVGGSGNRATATNSAENWIKKFDDLDNVKFTKEGEGSYKTVGKLYKSDKSTPPTDRAVRGMMASKK